VLTAVHAPQDNASELVNRLVISGISAYVRSDQKDWDENLSRISYALRSSVHSSIGPSPYYMVYGYLRKLILLDDRSVLLNRSDSFEIVHTEAEDA